MFNHVSLLFAVVCTSSVCHTRDWPLWRTGLAIKWTVEVNGQLNTDLLNAIVVIWLRTNTDIVLNLECSDNGMHQENILHEWKYGEEYM